MDIDVTKVLSGGFAILSDEEKIECVRIRTLTRVTQLALGFYIPKSPAPSSPFTGDTPRSGHKAFELVTSKAHGMVEQVGSRYTDMGPSLGFPLMSCVFLKLLLSR